MIGLLGDPAADYRPLDQREIEPAQCLPFADGDVRMTPGSPLGVNDGDQIRLLGIGPKFERPFGIGPSQAAEVVIRVPPSFRLQDDSRRRFPVGRLDRAGDFSHAQQQHFQVGDTALRIGPQRRRRGEVKVPGPHQERDVSDKIDKQLRRYKRRLTDRHEQVAHAQRAEDAAYVIFEEPGEEQEEVTIEAPAVSVGKEVFGYLFA